MMTEMLFNLWRWGHDDRNFFAQFSLLLILQCFHRNWIAYIGQMLSYRNKHLIRWFSFILIHSMCDSSDAQLLAHTTSNLIFDADEPETTQQKFI